MIVDNIENFKNYECLNPLFKLVGDFIASHDLQKLEEGKYEIAGKDLFVNVTTAGGKTREEAFVETHKKMIDVQIPLSTSETYGYVPESRLPEGEYDSDKDITKFFGVEVENYVTCSPGMFAVFFPQDGHAPCISDEQHIRKVIFKVKA